MLHHLAGGVQAKDVDACPITVPGPLLVAVQSVVGWERRGVVTGASMFTRNIGSAVGVANRGIRAIRAPSSRWTQWMRLWSSSPSSVPAATLP